MSIEQNIIQKLKSYLPEIERKRSTTSSLNKFLKEYPSIIIIYFNNQKQNVHESYLLTETEMDYLLLKCNLKALDDCQWIPIMSAFKNCLKLTEKQWTYLIDNSNLHFNLHIDNHPILLFFCYDGTEKNIGKENFQKMLHHLAQTDSNDLVNFFDAKNSIKKSN